MSPKVLFIAPSAYRLGGVQTWLDYLLPGLQKVGFDVHLGLVEGNLHDPAAYLKMHRFAPVHCLRPMQFTPKSRQLAIAELVNRLQPDVLLSVNIVDTYLAKRFFEPQVARSCRVVATNHALQPDYYEDFRQLSGFIDCLICTNRLSTALGTELAGFAEDRLFYAPYGVEDAMHMRDRLEGQRIQIGYAGRLATDQKEILDVARICAAARDAGLDFDLLVAGTGPQEAEFRSEIERLGLGGQTKMLGHVKSEDIPSNFYAKVDVLLITSSWETGPIVAWEAMNHNVAVVTSKYLGSMAEGSLVDGVNCRMFDCGSFTQAADALLEMDDPEVRREIAGNARKLVAERYTVQASVDRWAEVINHARELPVKQVASSSGSELPEGLVERLLGERFGARIRRLLGRRYEPETPGQEWPHGYARGSDMDGFWRAASAVEFRKQA